MEETLCWDAGEAGGSGEDTASGFMVMGEGMDDVPMKTRDAKAKPNKMMMVAKENLFC